MTAPLDLTEAGSRPAFAPRGLLCTRRALVAGAGLVVTAAVTGCAGRPGPDASASAAGKGVAGSISEVPVGGGRIYAAEKVVVTQPEPGVFQAFSASCTHQGCTVQEVADGMIRCPCHGSEFNTADGSVKQGPAAQPLPRREIRVEGESFTVV